MNQNTSKFGDHGHSDGGIKILILSHDLTRPSDQSKDRLTFWVGTPR